VTYDIKMCTTNLQELQIKPRYQCQVSASNRVVLASPRNDCSEVCSGWRRQSGSTSRHVQPLAGRRDHRVLSGELTNVNVEADRRRWRTVGRLPRCLGEVLWRSAVEPMIRQSTLNRNWILSRTHNQCSWRRSEVVPWPPHREQQYDWKTSQQWVAVVYPTDNQWPYQCQQGTPHTQDGSAVKRALTVAVAVTCAFIVTHQSTQTPRSKSRSRSRSRTTGTNQHHNSVTEANRRRRTPEDFSLGGVELQPIATNL